MTILNRKKYIFKLGWQIFNSIIQFLANQMLPQKAVMQVSNFQVILIVIFRQTFLNWPVQACL
jgi:hypothetical protein